MVVTPEDTRGRRTSDKPNNTAPSSAEITDLKSKGLVEFKGRGKPSVANNIWVDNPQTKKKSMLCTNFSTVGYYCRFGTGCFFFTSVLCVSYLKPPALLTHPLLKQNQTLLSGMPVTVSKYDLPISRHPPR
jgi:hypothetical protein